MLNKVAGDHSHHSLGSFPRNLGRGDVLRDLFDWQNNFASHATHLSGGKMILRGFHPPKNIIITKYNTNAAQKESLMGGGGWCPYSLADLDGGGVHIHWRIWTGGVGGPKSAVTPVRSTRPTTLNSKISSISTTSRPLWSYGYTLWKVV